MIKTVLLVPRSYNEGAFFPEALWEDLEARLAAFGGLSTRDGVRGVWLDAGMVYRDESNEYTVDLAPWRDLPARLAVAEWARVAFRQIAVRIEVAGIPEVLR